MTNPIPIRPWSRLASLRSVPAPESHPKPHTAELSLKATNTFSNDNNESATKSLPITPDLHSPIEQKLKLTTPITFPTAKLKAQPQIEGNIEKPDGNGNGIGQKNEKEVMMTTKENELMKEKGIHTKLSGSGGQYGIRVITISGENKGACMQITKSHKKPFHKMRSLYANSNVQCVNNSMVFHTSLTHHDPGVHLIIPKKQFGEGLIHLKERDSGQRN